MRGLNFVQICAPADQNGASEEKAPDGHTSCNQQDQKRHKTAKQLTTLRLFYAFHKTGHNTHSIPANSPATHTHARTPPSQKPICLPSLSCGGHLDHANSAFSITSIVSLTYDSTKTLALTDLFVSYYI